MDKHLMVLTTTPTKKIAQKICRVIIKDSLAACCQITGLIESHYIWKNRVEVKKEYMCIIKTTNKQYKMLEKVIKNNHFYEVPEIIAVNIVNGYKPYLNWIKDLVKK